MSDSDLSSFMMITREIVKVIILYVVATQHKSIVYHSIIHNDRDARRYPIGFGCFVIMIDYSLFYASRWWCIFIAAVLSPLLLCFLLCLLTTVVSALLFLLTVISDLLSPLLSPLSLCRYFAIPAHCCSDHVMIAWCLSLDSVCVCSALLACVCFLLLFLSSLLIHPFLYLVLCTLLFFLYLLSSVHTADGIIVGHICVFPFPYISTLFSNDSYRVVSIIIVTVCVCVCDQHLNRSQTASCQLSSDSDHINNTSLSLHQSTYTYWW